MFLKLNYSKNEAEFYYVDQENGKKIRDDRHYSGKITERRSISLSDGNKNAQMILAGDPTESSLNGFSAIWIKEHRPEGNEGSKRNDVSNSFSKNKCRNRRECAESSLQLSDSSSWTII